MFALYMLAAWYFFIFGVAMTVWHSQFDRQL